LAYRFQGQGGALSPLPLKIILQAHPLSPSPLSPILFPFLPLPLLHPFSLPLSLKLCFTMEWRLPSSSVSSCLNLPQHWDDRPESVLTLPFLSPIYSSSSSPSPSSPSSFSSSLCVCDLFCFSFFFLSFIYLIYEYTVVVFRMSPKRASDPITDGCEPPCGCWELNSGPLEEQPVLLTAEPSLQLPYFVFRNRVSV
ncbi:mCG145372, partial [Mus musculus]